MHQQEKETRTLNDFHESLKLLATKLNQNDYAFVAGVLFRCLMGSKFGYRTTIKEFYKIFKAYGLKTAIRL